MLVCIYNICGISGRENIQYYEYALNSILNQDFDDFRVVVSSCLSLQSTIDHLSKKYPQKILINWIKDKVPVNVSFNHSALEYIKRFGNAEGYIYIDSGCNFGTQTNILSEFNKLLNTQKYGLITIRTDTNTGFPTWFNIGKHDDDNQSFNNYFRNLQEHFLIPVGKCCNLHCTLFSSQLMNYYDKLLPDIFAGECSESVLSFLTAALNLKWVIHKDLEIHHETSLDGPSSGFAPWKWVKESKRPTIDHPFGVSSIIDIIKGGLKFGLGYEECSGIAIHDNSMYDDNGFAKNPELKQYIKEKLFVPKDIFNYETINSQWYE